MSSLKQLTPSLAMTVAQQISFKVKFNKPLNTQDEKKKQAHTRIQALLQTRNQHLSLIFKKKGSEGIVSKIFMFYLQL